jgi:opacity protein-like surface antigen
MNRKILTIILVILLGSNKIYSQVEAGRTFDNFFTFAWDVNIPMGDKYVDAVSYAGAKMEYRAMISSNVSIGLDLSWNSYYEYQPYQTYHVDANTDITTDLYKYNYTLPIAVTAHYYFQNGGIFLPYVGLGMGAVYSTPRLYFNIYEINQENWGFLLRPEIGTVIKFDPAGDMGILVGARYSMSSNSEPTFRIENLQAIGFQLGLVWLY